MKLSLNTAQVLFNGEPLTAGTPPRLGQHESAVKLHEHSPVNRGVASKECSFLQDMTH